MRNRIVIVIGLLLIGAGAIALSYGGIPYRSQDVVIDVGPLSATAESNRTWAISPAVSGLVVVGGIVLIVLGARRT